MSNKILERLEELKGSSPGEKLEINVTYKDKKVYKYEIEIEGFKKEVIENENVSLYYFFKDMASDLEEFLIKKHRDMLFDELEKES